MFRHRWVIALAAIATALVLVSADAYARAGSGFSGGPQKFGHGKQGTANARAVHDLVPR